MIADDRGSQITKSSVICMETHSCDRLRPIAIVQSNGNQSSAICVCSNRFTWLAMNKVKLVTRNLWRKLHDMSAFTTVTVKISKTKTKRLTVGEKIGEKFNLSAAEVEVKFRETRTAYGRYLKRLKMLRPSGSGRDAIPREFQNLK